MRDVRDFRTELFNKGASNRIVHLLLRKGWMGGWMVREFGRQLPGTWSTALICRSLPAAIVLGLLRGLGGGGEEGRNASTPTVALFPPA